MTLLFLSQFLLFFLSGVVFIGVMGILPVSCYVCLTFLDPLHIALARMLSGQGKKLDIKATVHFFI